MAKLEEIERRVGLKAFNRRPRLGSQNRIDCTWVGKWKRVGDDGSHYPECEKIVREFWDYDEADQAKAREISAQYLARRKKELSEGIRNFRTSGKP